MEARAGPRCGEREQTEAGGGGGGAAAAQVVSGLPGRKSQSPGLLYVQWGRIRLRERDAEWSQWLEVDKEEKDTDIYTRL